VGEVDKGTTVTDYDPEEQERGITINAASVTFPWKDVEINLIDTPGHVDFTAEVERSLRVLDGGVVVFSAREGVEAQSETVWHQADKYRVPRIAFINKMDREGADYFGTLDEIRDRLNCKPIPVNLPIGAGPPHLKEAFRGLIDLVLDADANLLTARAKGPRSSSPTFPPSLRDEAELWRGQMLDQLSMYSDGLTSLLLAEEPVPAALVHRRSARRRSRTWRCGAVRVGAGRDRRAAGARRGWPSICPARPTFQPRRRRSEGSPT